MSPSHRLPVLAAALALVTGCATDLRVDYPFDGALPEGGHVVNEAQGDGSDVTEVDATNKESWVYVDLETGEEVPGDQAVGSTVWDLGFQRFKILGNGGVSGTGTTEIAILNGTDFDGLTQAPSSGYLVDAVDGPDANADVDSAFMIGDGWYAYNLLQHKLAPRELIYVIHTGEGGYFALQMLSYYDAAGTGGRVSFRWKRLAPPNAT